MPGGAGGWVSRIGPAAVLAQDPLDWLDETEHPDRNLNPAANPLHVLQILIQPARERSAVR